MRLHPGALLACVVLLMQTTASATLVNSNLIRTVTLGASGYVSEQIGVVVQNTDAQASHTTYLVQAGDSTKQGRLASLHVHERKSGRELPVTRQGTEYVVTLAAALKSGDKIGLSIDAVYTQMVRPLPEGNVAQTDDQRWAWDDALLVASPYPTRKQKTIVALDKSARLVRYEGTRGSLSDQSGNVVFGPFAGSDREAVGDGRVVYVSNAEHLEATHVRREYFASHWDDTLHVSDSFDVRNAGPQTPGHAVDSVQRMMTRFTGARDNLVKQFAQHVPVDAREVFFVDAIGNVSTSAVDRVPGSPGKRMLRLKPRFPLAGGWRYAWRHGYRLPLGQHLRHDASGRFRLRVPFIEPLVASAADDKQPVRSERTAAVLAYELHVTLPQGARNVAVHAAFDAEYSVQRAKHYLDAPGVARPVVVVAMRNVPPEMMREHVVVSYDLSWAAVWLKPAAVAACVLALFALASVVGRLQLGLAPVAGKAKAKAKAD